MKRSRLAVLVVVAALPGGCRGASGPGDAGAPVPAFVRLEPPGSPAELLGDGHLTKRRAIRADVPSTLSWTVQVPPRGRLDTHLSFAPRSRDELAEVTCTARVEVVPADGTPRVVLTRDVDPFEGWQPVTAGLEEWGGQTVVLSLGLRCAAGDGLRTWADAARWSVPVVYAPRPPRVANVLLVTVDTLRADHLHAYGYSRPTSPHVDALAARGLLYRRAETVQSATWPALTTLQTSLYPSAHGVVENGHDLREGVPTLAQLLRSRGYSTSAFLANMKRARHPGFSRLSVSGDGPQHLEDVEVADLAIEQLRLVRHRPFFLWLHLISPHASYDPPPPWDTAFTRPGASSVSGSIEELVRIRSAHRPLAPADVEHLVGLYDGDVAFADIQVGRVLEALRELGLERSTLVVFTADHGEDLYEHNAYPFHSPSMYSSSLHVPLVLSLPGVLPEGATTDQLASLVDVAPTVLGLLDLPIPPSFQGRNLLPGGDVPKDPVRRRLFSETGGRIHGVRAPGFRLVLNPGGEPPGAPGGAYPIAPLELYSLASDPREQTNLAGKDREVARGLLQDLARWKARDLPETVPTASDQPIDPQTREELRALGYLVE